MHVTIAEALFRTGIARRNPSLMEEYERLKESEWLSREHLRDLQLRRAVEFLTFAGTHSAYYRKLFRERGFVPDRMTTAQDLRVLPTIDKAELIALNDKIHTDFSFSRSFTAETSGTTGSALQFRKNERWDSINRAQMMRSYDWYGVKPWQRSGYLWGYNTRRSAKWKTGLFDALQNRFRIFTYDRASVRRFALKLRAATYLAGYSSMIYEVAKIINDLSITVPLSLVKGTSEMILEAYQGDAQRAFGRRIVSEYGAAESGLIAFECPEGRMHINIENVIVEVDANDSIIVTNLASYSFPIIRYRLGDTVRLSDDVCACGRQHPLVSEISGRRGATVQGRHGNYPALTFYYVFKNIALTKGILLNYKAVQDAPGTVTIFIENLDGSRHESLIVEELHKYFQDDVSFEIRFVQEFEVRAKKSQYFESRI